MAVCTYGYEGFRDELKAMNSDYYGECIPWEKAGRMDIKGFQSEDEALEFLEAGDWWVYRWNGKQWERAELKRSGVVWKPE